jgi:recombination protein RecR
MAGAFDGLIGRLKRLPGVGHRSAERIALHLLVGKPEELGQLVDALTDAGRSIKRCSRCGNLAEEDLCSICADGRRIPESVCVVESVSDLAAIERAESFKGLYHVLHGKLSPIHGIGPEQLNLGSLEQRLADGSIKELILALGNDIEGEATCHYITEYLPLDGVDVTRIGFGLPSGGGVLYADSVTLKNALEARREYT